MPRCRCKLSCTTELHAGDYVVEVKRFNKPDQPSYVLLGHLVAAQPPLDKFDVREIVKDELNERLGA